MDRTPLPPSLYRWFFLLAMAQFVLLMVLAHLGPGSGARRAESFPGASQVQCQDQRADVRIPLNFPMTTLHCDGNSCRHSRYVQPDSIPGESQTHIVAVEGGRGSQPKGPQWPRIEVALEPTSEPLRLVLSSKESVQWDLRGVEDASLEEVHVITPRAARITGLSEHPDVGLYWHGEDIVCVHPYSWWDVDNSNNEYQRFVASVRKLLSVKEVSFQGSRWGSAFKVPFYESYQDEARHVLNFRKKWNSAERSLASVHQEVSFGPIYSFQNHTLKDEGWGEIRAGQSVVTEKIPEDRTLLDRRSDGKLFLLTDGARLLVYSPKTQEETALPAPRGLDGFSRLHLARFAPSGKKVKAYFRDFGGVVQEWDPASQTWSQSFELYRQELEQWLWEEDHFWGLSLHKNIVQLLKYDSGGRKVDQREYLLPWGHGGPRTRWTLEKKGPGFLLKHYSAAAPEGHWYYLGASGEVQILSH